jgi:hypothetical protein
VIFETAGQHMVQDRAGRSSERLFMRFAPEDRIATASLVLRENAVRAIGSYVEDIAQFVPVFWLTPRQEPHIPDSYIMRKGCDHPFALRPGQQELFAGLAALVARIGGDLANVTVVDQMDLVKLQMPQDFLTCERSFWTDADHLSTEGRASFGDRLAPALLR